MTTTYDTTVTLAVEHQAIGIERTMNELRDKMTPLANDGWQAEHGVVARKVGNGSYHVVAHMRKDYTLVSADPVPLVADQFDPDDILVTDTFPAPAPLL